MGDRWALGVSLNNFGNVPPARKALDDEAQARAWEEGRALSLEEAIGVALDLGGP